MQKHRAGGPTDQVDIQTEAQSGLHQLLSPIVLDTVEQGEWAARMAAEKNYAVALLDMNMPGGWSGLRTAEEIIKHSPQTRIIFVSAHIDYSLDKLQRKLGANFAFLHKPIDENALIQLVMLLVNGYQRELRLVGAEAGTLQANQVKDELIQRLEESEKRFRDLAESASDWIWETDYEGRYTFVSEPVNNFLGYTGPEILGRTTWELMPEE
ncbi:MAG: response regulator, partial [Gammaproteobacteria bacterium]|nr:response regulator [Gammaproteobacteria bacterium]